ncbi:MAG: helix-turn-helix transcriptional regulator [Candidatus Promineifilaceae bacterium]
MSRSATKAARLLKIEALLLAHPEGLAPAEIARKLQVHRSTVGRYLPDLPAYIYIEDDGRWRIDRQGLLVNVRLSLHEALAVHLAARLLATRMDRQNPHAAAALRKLGVALEKLAPQVSRHLLQSAGEVDDAAQLHDPLYLQVLEKLTLAWAERRLVSLWHRRQPGSAVHEYLFAPYFIEPSAIGQATYVIGRRQGPDEPRTFKIERIERIELLADRYEIPADFDPGALLADAWGIWYTAGEPVEVVLRFSPRVAGRVQESQWHRSQRLEAEADGGLRFRAWVAEPQEMMPWIRGWGAEVEVLAPAGLRQELVAEAGRLARLYNLPAAPHLGADTVPHSPAGRGARGEGQP